MQRMPQGASAWPPVRIASGAAPARQARRQQHSLHVPAQGRQRRQSRARAAPRGRKATATGAAVSWSTSAMGSAGALAATRLAARVLTSVRASGAVCCAASRSSFCTVPEQPAVSLRPVLHQHIQQGKRVSFRRTSDTCITMSTTHDMEQEVHDTIQVRIPTDSLTAKVVDMRQLSAERLGKDSASRVFFDLWLGYAGWGQRSFNATRAGLLPVRAPLPAGA